MKYVKIWQSSAYSVGIYDSCYATILIRQDGERMRLEAGTIKWSGNTGGYHQVVYYINGRKEVRKTIKELRMLQLKALRYGLEKTCSAISHDLILGESCL